MYELLSPTDIKGFNLCRRGYFLKQYSFYVQFYLLLFITLLFFCQFILFQSKQTKMTTRLFGLLRFYQDLHAYSGSKSTFIASRMGENCFSSSIPLYVKQFPFIQYLKSSAFIKCNSCFSLEVIPTSIW